MRTTCIMVIEEIPWSLSVHTTCVCTLPAHCIIKQLEIFFFLSFCPWQELPGLHFSGINSILKKDKWLQPSSKNKNKMENTFHFVFSVWRHGSLVYLATSSPYLLTEKSEQNQLNKSPTQRGNTFWENDSSFSFFLLLRKPIMSVQETKDNFI